MLNHSFLCTSNALLPSCFMSLCITWWSMECAYLCTQWHSRHLLSTHPCFLHSLAVTMTICYHSCRQLALSIYVHMSVYTWTCVYTRIVAYQYSTTVWSNRSFIMYMHELCSRLMSEYSLISFLLYIHVFQFPAVTTCRVILPLFT